ncbi:M48 family metalloprotease [Massilia soli]
MKTKPAPALRRLTTRIRRAVTAVSAAALTSFVVAIPAGYAQATTAAPSLPTLGDTAREDLSPVFERKLGEEIMRDIRRDRDFIDDDVILEYMNSFGNALVAAYPGARGETNADYYFFAVRDPVLNAFALPGGFIGAHTGLLIAAQSESELASVMSHEIGHVAQRHIARMLGQQRQDALIPLAAMLLAALASKAGSDAAMGVFMGGQGLAIQRQLDFSRDAEREADRVGFQIMGAGGYDTTGMVEFFQRLQSASRNYSDLTPAYLRSHPLTSERISDIQSRIRETPYRQRIDSIEFHLVRARARVLQDESVQGLRDTHMAFESQLTQLNRQQKAGAQYGLAFLELKRGNHVKAQEWLDKARATMKPSDSGAVMSAQRAGSYGAPTFASLGVEIKLAPGQPAAVKLQGMKEAELAHLQYPLSRGIARQYADAMIANGKLDDAAKFLRDQVQLYREEPKLHDLLAKAYAAQGKLTLQHMALAESYALGGSVLAALDQLTIARKAKDASFYDLALIDAREREWQAKRREEIEEAKK